MDDRRKNTFVIDENDWENMTESQRLWIVFKTIRLLHDRVCVLEGRPFVDKFLTICGGAIGGFAAALGLNFLGKG